MKKLFSLLTLALLTMSAWGANTYVKVTSTDQLVAGKKYIVVNEEAAAGMGGITGGSTKYAAAISGLTIDNGVTDIEDLAVEELTLGGATGAWTFEMGEGAYLYWGSGNSVNTTDDATAATAKWTVTASANGGYILTNAGATETRVLQYNANSGQERFACYKGTQKDAVLYVQDPNAAPVVEIAAPTLPAAQTFVESLEITITNNEAGATLYYSTDGLAWTAYTAPFTLTETTTVYAKASKDGHDSPVVSATYVKVEPGVIVFTSATDPGNGTASASAWTVTKEGVTLDCSNGWVDATSYRIYKDQTLTISSTAGTIVKIEIVGNSGSHLVSNLVPDAGDWAVENNTGTWEGTATSVVFTASAQARASEIRVYLDGDAPIITVAAPVFNPSGRKFAGSIEVALTCETEGADIYYMLNDGDEILYTAPFTLTETTTVKAYAEKDGTESTMATATYTRLPEVATLAEANALATKTDFVFTGNVVAVYQHKSNLWVKDATGVGLIYGNQVPTIAEGSTIKSGWDAQFYIFRGHINEYQYPNNVEATDAPLQTIEATEYTEAQVDTTTINQRILVKDLTLTTAEDSLYLYTADGMAIYNMFEITYPESVEGKTFDVEAMVSYYNNAVQLLPIAITEHSGAQVILGDVNDDQKVSIEDVTALIDYLLGGGTAINVANADLSGDGKAGIEDVTLVIDMLLGGN